MTHKGCSPGTIPVCLLLALALMLAVPASAEWKEKVLYSFQGGASGSVPAGGVVFDKAGNLYGVTFDGVVFQLKPPLQKGRAWAENMLYVFQGVSKGDGSTPSGGLVIDSAGNLYGVTAYGGTGNCVLLGSVVGCGTVYEISPPKAKGGAWKETILYSFPTAKQGYLPNGNLVLDSAGNLYGATTFGGGNGTTCDTFYGGQCGAAFELIPPKEKGGKWTQKVLHAFSGIATGKQFGDGANPNGGLVLDSKGTIYGTTYIGGYNCPHNSNQGCGTVFKLGPPTMNGGARTEAILHRFKRDTSDGGNPMAGLRFDGIGNLYGTTLNGGPGQYGTVFRLVPTPAKSGSWTETIVHGFKDDDHGADPMAGLIFDSTGNLYGTTLGGVTHYGVVFRLQPPKHGSSWSLAVLYNLTGSPDGDHPTAAVTFDSEGNLYSTTEWGGTGQSCQGGCGTVFEVSP
jgi:uncharacterized repeat protein (TIGR03803 family)